MATNKPEKRDDKEMRLREHMAGAKKKHGVDSQQYKDAREAVRAYRESQGLRTKAPAPPAPPPPNNPNTDEGGPKAGVQPAVPGSGDPLSDPNKKDVTNLFGDFGKQATAAGNIYSDVTPLTQLDSSLSAPETTALQGLSATADAAKVRDPRQEQFLDMYLRNAQQGLNAPELTALREEGLSGINDTLAGTLRQLSLKNAGSGISGPAQTIGQQPAVNSALQASRGLERDIITKNTDFMQTNLNAGHAAANKTNDSYFANLSTAGNNFWTGAQNAAKQTIDTQKWNADQQTNYAAGKLGSLVGGADWGAQEHFANEANDIAREGINAAKSAGGGGGGSSQAAGYTGSSLGENWKGAKSTNTGSGQPTSY